MKYFKDDLKTVISGENPEKIELEDALKQIESFPNGEGNFIGFVNDNDESIQFIKCENNDWMIDIPIIEPGEFIKSKQTLISSDLTIDVIKKFFGGSSIEEIIKITKARFVKEGEDVDPNYNKKDDNKD